MNITEIRDEIPKAFKDNFASPDHWIRDHGGNKDTHGIGPYVKDVQAAARMLVDWAYEAGKAEAAKDPKAWYVLDKNGEQVYIGDTAKTIYGEQFTVECLGNESLTTWKKDGISQESYIDSYLEKVIPDSWEKWEQDLAKKIEPGIFGCFSEEAAEIEAESFANRAKKLAEVD